MNGTTLRIATTAACIAALAAPGSALAAKKHHSAKKAATPAAVIVQVPHDYDAGGNGGAVGLPGVARVNLFDPLELATTLGNQTLGQLGLPPIQLPTL